MTRISGAARRRRDERGQALLVVIAITAGVVLLLAGVQLSVVGQTQIASRTELSQKALQAAEAGVNDYQAWVDASTNKWTYAKEFCSSGVTWSTTTPNPDTKCSKTPDPHNPAFSGKFDPNCATSASNATSGTPGHGSYYGWEVDSTATGISQEYQYVVDSRMASSSTKPYVHVFVTGRAGHSGQYTCTTLKLGMNGPVNQVLAKPVTILPAVSCTGTTKKLTPPSNAVYMQIQATGGNGAGGGNGGGILTFGGGQGGNGETATAIYKATTVYVNAGCQGGGTSQITTGGGGFAPGGSLPKTGDAGGGGGASAVCTVTPCKITNPTISSTTLTSKVYMIAGGGGGGGESFLFATGGAGGSGGDTHTVGTPYSTGNAGTGGFFSSGGGGGTGTAYLPQGKTGTKTGFGGDGGGGGGGFAGGAGGTSGWSGGGGGAGESWINNGAAVGYSGTGSFTHPAASYGHVTITWLTGAKTEITKATSGFCGLTRQRTVSVPSGATITISVSGGGGGSGDTDNPLSFLFGGGGGIGGHGTALSSAFRNTSSSTVFISAVQGCDGTIGLKAGALPGGTGLGKGGKSGSASGAGGGASAICVGSTTATSKCSTASSANVLAVAGGGGGGPESVTTLGCTPGPGGNAGLGSNWSGGSSTGQPGTGVVGGGNSAGPGGTGGGATYSPTGGNGSTGTADSGGGGGGYQGGKGGNTGSTCFTIFGFRFGNPAGGGGGGSSYLDRSLDGLTLQACAAGRALTTAKFRLSCPVLAGEYPTDATPLATTVRQVWWGQTAPGTNGTVQVTQIAQVVPPGVTIQGVPTGIDSTTW
ncbi:MAG: pilus assembly PilX family protein [Acidimicrobiales bacterium]